MEISQTQQTKFDQLVQKLIEDDLCMVAINFHRSYPNILFNVQQKSGQYLTFLIEPTFKQVYCFEPRNVPTKNISETRRGRKHVKIDDSVVELLKNCSLFQKMFKKYYEYCEKTGKPLPKYTEDLWLQQLKKLENTANNKQAAQGE